MRELVGIYRGDNLNVDDIVDDMINYRDTEKYVFVGSVNKDTPTEERARLMDKMLDGMNKGALNGIHKNGTSRTMR